MPKHWGLKVSTRFDRLTAKAAEMGAYTHKAEFVRAAVKGYLATLEPITEVDDDELDWSIKVPPMLDEQVIKAVKTGAFHSKAELIRYAVRLHIKLLLPRTKL
jgi:hypothetical protein